MLPYAKERNELQALSSWAEAAQAELRNGRRLKPSLTVLNAMRRAINLHAPNLSGELPASILRYLPGAGPDWLAKADRDDAVDYREKYGE